jgi:hypothetical protein
MGKESVYGMVNESAREESKVLAVYEASIDCVEDDSVCVLVDGKDGETWRVSLPKERFDDVDMEQGRRLHIDVFLQNKDYVVRVRPDAMTDITHEDLRASVEDVKRVWNHEEGLK